MSFSGDMKRFVRITEQASDEIVRATTIALFNGVIRDTPVDTGRARGDWQTTVETPANGENGREDPTPAGRDGGPAQAEVVANTPRKAGGETYLTNSLPYIEELENGSSKQAPSGMVRRNLARVQRNLEKHIRDNKV